MRRKDYKKGMSDAMEAYEAFGEKQEAAIQHVAGEVGKTAEKVDKLGGKIGEITDYITDQEKAELYKLNTPVDIADLDDAEKRILLAVLYQLSADEEELTEAQQNYVRAVQQYLKLYNPQTEIDLEAVENIEDISAQKAVLQAVLEFFYLGIHPGTYNDDQLDFLDCFQVNRKTRKEITAHIEAIIEAVGLKGLAEKYGNDEVIQQVKDESEVAFKDFEEKISGDWLHVGGSGLFLIHLDKNWSNISRLACDDSEGYKDKSKCHTDAQRQLERYHREMSKKMAPYTKRYGEDSIYKSLSAGLDYRIGLQKKELSKIRSPKTATTLSEIAQYLTKAKVVEEAAAICDQLAEKYRLPSIDSYNSEIEYETWDPSEGEDNMFAKAFAKGLKRYGYNINSAVDSIENDGIERLKLFDEDLAGKFNDLIDHHIIDPIQRLLPKLENELYNPDEDN